ncbi:MAG: glycosyltransferase family 4 protein [Thermodesulfovibrionia bacterium]|nr:glycosyltransferase family 4 protein [Thermodesulfovibrionia bacterium]
MKIALIRKNYTPYGGAENYMKQVAAGLVGKGHDIHILSAGNWEETEFHVHKIEAASRPSLLSNLLFSMNIKSFLDKETFDSVVSFERTGYGDIYRAGDGCHKEWLNKRKKHEPFYKRISFAINPHHRMLLYLEKKTFENLKIIIANSNMVKDDIIRNYAIPSEKIRVIYNGVDLQRFHPADDDKKEAAKCSMGLQGMKVVLFVGADLDRKGLPVLLKALSALEDKGVKLLVAGRKAKKRHICLIRKLGIEKSVVLWGPEKNIEKLYAAADIFVLPTIYDPFSNATLEAMASGLPVITTSSNGAAELINSGVEGYVVEDHDDAGSIAVHISAALSDSEEMGRRARLKAEQFPIEKAVESIIETISGAGA